MSRGAFARAVVLIALVGLVLRVVYVLALGAHPPLGKDGTWYALQAGSIGDGVGYVDPGRYFGFRGAVPTVGFPPLWPGLLSLVYDVGLGTIRAFRITGGVVGTVSVVLTAYLGRAVVGHRAGLAAAAILAVSPYMIAADASVMSESLFIALVTAAVLAAVGARREPGFWRFALLGLLLGLATLTRTDGIVVAVFLIPATALGAGTKCGMRSNRGRRVGLAGVALLVAVVVLVPWAIRNTDVMGEPVLLSSNSGTLLAGANCKATYGGRDIGGWDLDCGAVPERRARTELARAEVGRSLGLDYARDHLGQLVAVLPVRVLRGWGLWSPTVLADSEVIESRNRAAQLAGWPIELLILGLAGVGVVRLLQAHTPIAPLLAVPAAATVVLIGSWGNQRFRLVAEPELAVFAAVTVLAIYDARRRRSAPQNFPVRP